MLPKCFAHLCAYELFDSSNSITNIRSVKGAELRATGNDRHIVTRQEERLGPAAIFGEGGACDGSNGFARGAAPNLHGRSGARCLISAKVF